MAPEQPTVPLGDLVEEIRGISYGIVQPGAHWPGGTPIVRVTDIRHGRIDTTNPLCVHPEIAAKYKRTTLRGGELLLTLVGTVGETAIAPAALAGWNTARAVAVLPIRHVPGARWIRYALQTDTARSYIGARLNTTVQATLNLRDVALIPVPLPDARIRDAASSILGALDDKIELNRRMNQTLEEMAQAIFKSWFVDFDGHTEFEESELGRTPKGWRPGSLGDVIDLHDSKRVPLSSLERDKRRGPYPYYGAASVMDHVDDYLFDGVFVLMGEDGSVIDDAGHPIVQYVWGRFWVNNHAHVLTGRGAFSQEQLLLFLRQCTIRPFVTGAVQPKLNQKNLRSIPLCVPPDSVCGAFEDIVQPLFARLRANSDETETLAEIRDTLLPKLISGEIRVPDAEKLVEDVA